MHKKKVRESLSQKSTFILVSRTLEEKKITLETLSLGKKITLGYTVGVYKTKILINVGTFDVYSIYSSMEKYL
jgi:hypothetical protein